MEWFVQKSHRAGFESSLARNVICVRRNEDDRDSPVIHNYSTLELEPIHARHPHIDNQARRIVHVI
jgi:hypothetical protein